LDRTSLAATNKPERVGFDSPAFHDERLFAKANACRVGAVIVTTSVVVVFVEKFGLGKIRFVRLSGSRRLANFANWVSVKKPRSCDRWQSPNLCGCLICDSHLQQRVSFRHAGLLLHVSCLKLTQSLDSGRHRFSEFFRTPLASGKAHHRHPAEPASHSSR
jgi:hypothetical protein